MWLIGCEELGKKCSQNNKQISGVTNLMNLGTI